MQLSDADLLKRIDAAGKRACSIAGLASTLGKRREAEQARALLVQEAARRGLIGMRSKEKHRHA